MTRSTLLAPLVLLSLVGVTSGCGGGSGPATSAAQSSSATTDAHPPGSSASSSSRAPSPAASLPSSSGSDATSQATGDIPDNQVFLTYRNRAAGYALRFPEGWTMKRTHATVTFRDKDNFIRAVVEKGAPPSTRSAVTSLLPLRKAEPTLKIGAPSSVRYPQGIAIKVSYEYAGPPNSVTNKRPLLLVDRYLYGHRGNVAILDLGTPKGVDNIDAYRLISRSFAWR